MCGIIGYVGTKEVVPILLSGLERLEYRGYDSAGVAVLKDGKIQIRKAKGRLNFLKERLEEQPCEGTLGIGHTRWATHGEPSDINSHPHTDMKGDIAIVHNGIIENYLQLKNWLIDQGCVFVSDTDTEVVAHMLNHFYEGDMLQAIFKVLPQLQGSFALGIISQSDPDTLYCTRKDSPLVVGHTEHGNFIASDIPAILEYSRDVYLLDDLDVAVLHRDSIQFYGALGNAMEKEAMHIDWDIKVAEKGGYPHFMLKEIHEEPTALRDTLNPLIDSQKGCMRSEAMPLDEAYVKDIRHITIVACGTAYHAGIVAKYVYEKKLRIPVDVDIASEFRYRDPIVEPNSLFIIISQSGETADSIAAMREAQSRGAKVLAITNVVGSTISREADGVLNTWAGPEIAVASTKAYVSQLMALYALFLDLGHKRGVMDDAEVAAAIQELQAIPGKVQQILDDQTAIQQLAHKYFDRHSVFYLGRGLDYALAQEASLKLKEISYIHSEAYAAGELKHGTIALIEEGTLVVAMVTQDELMEKTISNINEVAVRGAKVLAVVNAGNTQLREEVDYVWHIPEVPNYLAPILTIVPMQLFAYYVALEKGCDIDKPRNLAKSVTVE